MTILGLAGSARTGSYNRQLRDLILGLVKEQGHAVESFEFADHPLPLYDADLEENDGLPDTVLQLRSAVSNADGIIWVCPEYNASITPLTKNAIDWVSRPDPETGEKNCWKGKPVMLAAASPGALGGIRGLPIVRGTLVELQAHVIPQQVSVAKAHEVLGDGKIKDERTQGFLEMALGEFLQMATRLKD